jgi:antitoxin MazE
LQGYLAPVLWRFGAGGYTVAACISKSRERYLKMVVAKWGNSLAVRLPASVVEALGLREGDDIEIHIAGAKTFEILKRPSSQELLARLRRFRGRLPADFKFDRLDADERA